MAARTGEGARTRPVFRTTALTASTCSDSQASKNDENVVYSLYENTKNGDFKPYIYKSTNRGGSWTSIAGDLPANGPVLAFAEDHVNPNLLFVGTEFGLFFTVDGGKKWIRLRTNLPTIPVRDLAIQERENDLVLATFGRGFYVLDDYSPLRQVTADVVPEGRTHLPRQVGGDRSSGDRQGSRDRRASSTGWPRTRPTAR